MAKPNVSRDAESEAISNIFRQLIYQPPQNPKQIYEAWNIKLRLIIKLGNKFIWDWDKSKLVCEEGPEKLMKSSRAWVHVGRHISANDPMGPCSK